MPIGFSMLSLLTWAWTMTKPCFADAIEAYEAIRWPLGRELGGKG